LADTRKKREFNVSMHKLFIDFKKAYNSVKLERLYNILLEFRIPKQLVRRIKMCLNETYSKVHIGNFDKFPIQNGLKQGDALIAIAFEFCFRICHPESPSN
jgi:hypothetical protein